jgi:hypothetical protein
MSPRNAQTLAAIAATFDAALASHTDALVAAWRRDHPNNSDHPDSSDVRTPPFPTRVDGFMSLIDAGWDADVAARPHAQRTTVVVHLDLEDRTAGVSPRTVPLRG